MKEMYVERDHREGKLHLPRNREGRPTAVAILACLCVVLLSLNAAVAYEIRQVRSEQDAARERFREDLREHRFLYERIDMLRDENVGLRTLLDVETSKTASLELEVQEAVQTILRLEEVHPRNNALKRRSSLSGTPTLIQAAIGPWRTARASTYGIGDGLLGHGTAHGRGYTYTGGRPYTRWWNGRLDRTVPVIAHRSLPFHTVVQFRYTYRGVTRTMIGEVLDRGPAAWTGRTWDLGPVVAWRLNFGGVHSVQYRIIYSPPRRA